MKTFQWEANWYESVKEHVLGRQTFEEWLRKQMKETVFFAKHRLVHDGYRPDEVTITEIEFYRAHWDVTFCVTAVAERTCCKMARLAEEAAGCAS